MCFFWLIILGTWLLWCMLCSSEKNAPVYIYGAASVLFLCVHPHLFVYCTWPAARVFFLDLFPVLQDELVLTYRTVSPSSGWLCWLLFLSKSCIFFGWVARASLQLWERNDGLVANVANFWKLLCVTGWASSNGVSAHTIRKGTSSHNFALFWNVWVYIWTCIYTCLCNSKKYSLSPLTPLCLSNFLP